VLNDLFNRYGAGYGTAVPNFSSLDYDPTWRVPTGIPGNKLSGKTPKGDIFVLEVNWPQTGGPSLNHVVFLNNKPYYFLWICNS